jgi:transposase
MRSKGTASALEATRRRAVRQVLAGQTQAAVATALGVHPETVAEWVRAHRAGGDAALAAKPHPGRKPFLTPTQEEQVLGWLAEKPTAHGFRTDLWTASRVAELIRRRFGVAFHPSYLREWLAKRGYSPQRPARRARQRNDAAIAGWVANDWPAIQKKRARRTPTSS